MPYCVNCGVELPPDAARCPLCQTAAWHPAEAAETAPYFPKNPAVVPPASRRALVALLTSMLASAALCCGILNLILRTERLWSLYVVGAAVLLWIWFVLPLVMKTAPRFFKLTLDVAAVGLYVWLCAIDLDGMVWFRGLALPLLGVAMAVVFVLSFLLRDNRRSRLSAIAMSIVAIGVGALGTEWCIDRYLLGGFAPGWSLVTVTICVALVIPLRIVRRVPALRAAARRRFDL